MTPAEHIEAWERVKLKERERDMKTDLLLREAYTEIERLREELAANARLLARQTDMAREAENNAYWNADTERNEHENDTDHDTVDMLDDDGKHVGWACRGCDWTVTFSRKPENDNCWRDAKLETLRAEILAVLIHLDTVAMVWGDVPQFRRSRDKLRALAMASEPERNEA